MAKAVLVAKETIERCEFREKHPEYVPNRLKSITCTVMLVLLALATAFLMFFTLRPVYAYAEPNYPNSLSGVTVTFNADPSEPSWADASGVVGVSQWVSANCTIVAPGGTSRTTTYIVFEDNTVNNPWYIGFNTTNNTTGASYYNGSARAWFFPGVGSSESAPTVTFNGANLLWNDYYFIRWVVDNSDYWTRYESQSLTATINYLDNGFSGTVSPSARIDILFWGDENPHELVSSATPENSTLFATNTGTFNISLPDEPGFYSLKFSKEGYLDYFSSAIEVTSVPGSFLASYYIDGTAYKFLHMTFIPTPEIVTVYCNGVAVHTLFAAPWEIVLDEEGEYYFTAFGTFNGQTMYYTSETFQVTGTGGGGIVEWFETLTSTITAFTEFLKGCINWLPYELRVFIVSMIGAIVALGVVRLILVKD